VAALRTSSVPLEQEAYRSLVALAAGDPLRWYEHYPLVTQVIKRDGLAYESAGEWRIPGRLLRAELLSAAESPASDVVPLLRPLREVPLRVLSGGPGGNQGTLVFVTPEGRKTLVLSGPSWEIFRRLYEAGGESVSLEILTDQLGKKLPALRSAIQRLQETLRRAGHDELIRNTRGGYALRLPT
jgi:hypothetical protein